MLGPAAVHTLRWLEALRGEGAELRQDGFFDETPDGRNAAREVAEGVLLTARDAFEERKVRYIRYLFANVAVYDAIIDAGLAALMLGRAEAQTWRQYVLLATVARAEEQPLPDGER